MALAVREERYEQLLDYGRQSRHEERKHSGPVLGLNWEARRRHLERAGEPVEEPRAAGTQKRKTAVGFWQRKNARRLWRAFGCRCWDCLVRRWPQFWPLWR